ncbi:MAG: glycosyltransferase family 2 protein [Steroidobacteraceae bacterium]
MEYSPEDAADPGLVSIVLCTYNGSRFLSEQLDSLFAQTYPHFEIVAVDDASTDETVAVLKRYAAREARLRIVVNPANLGFARNFERALGLSRGALIAPCDQDDIWLPEKIESLLAAIEGHAMAYCDSTLVDEHAAPLGHTLSRVVPMRDLDDPLPLAFGNCVSGHAMLFRRSLLERALPMPSGFYHDWWLATVAAATGGIRFCDRSLVLYRQHGGNVTDQRLKEMQVEAGLSATTEQDAVRASDKRADKLRYLRDMALRLQLIAELPGPHQPFAAELHDLWRAREAQWISWRLWRAMRGNQDRLLALTGMSTKKKARYCADFLWGWRAQGLMAP